MRKRLMALLMLFGIFPISALAVTVDFAKTGALEVRMESASFQNVEISLYQIGAIENENEDLYYRPDGAFAGCTANLNYTSAEEAEQAAEIIHNYILENNLKPIAVRKTDAQGTATFENLNVGVYYAEKSGGSAEIEMLPFLITVPYYQNGELLYTVEVNPKSEIHPQPSPTPQPPSDDKLPQTGVMRWPAAALSIGGCVLIALGAALVFASRRKREKE